MTTHNTALLQRAFGCAVELPQSAEHRREVSARQDRSGQRVTEQLLCHVQRAQGDCFAQKLCRNCHSTQQHRHLCGDALHTLYQNISGHARVELLIANFDCLCGDNSVAIFAIFFELNHVWASSLTHDLGGIQIHQLKHGVLCCQIAHRHVYQHVGVLYRANHEVQNRLVATNQFFQVRLIGNVAKFDGRFTTNKQLGHAILLPIKRDVVVRRGQHCCRALRDSAAACQELNHVPVVCVVFVSGLAEHLLQGGVAINGFHNISQHGLCNVFTKVQRFKPFVLSAECGQVHGERAVDGLAVTNVWLSVFENPDDVLDVRALFALNDVLFTAISAGDLLTDRGTVLDGLLHHVHTLVVLAQIHQHLGALELVHVLGKTLKASKAVNQHGLE